MYRPARCYSTSRYILLLKSTYRYLVCTFWEKYISVHTSIYQNRYISVYTSTYRYIPVHGGSALVHVPVHGVSLLVHSSTQQTSWNIIMMVYAIMRIFHSSTFGYMRLHSATSTCEQADPLFTCFIPAAAAPCWAGAGSLETC
jgi:hypothetical protein